MNRQALIRTIWWASWPLLFVSRPLAVNAADGKQLWQKQLGTPTSIPAKPVAAAAVVDGVVYVSLLDGFAALNASDGSMKWRVQANGLPSIQAVVNGIVYGSPNLTGASEQPAIYALKASDSSTLWRASVPAGFLTPVVGEKSGIKPSPFQEKGKARSVAPPSQRLG